MPAGFLLAAAVLAAPAAGPSPAPAPLATYDVSESRRVRTPAGERVRGTQGAVAVQGERARWTLPNGTFPRSSATAALADGTALTLVDGKERIAASATADDFASLFRGRPGPEGATTAAIRDVSASLEPAGAGPAFDGRPTVRWSLKAAWTLVVMTPGRVARVTTKVDGTIDALDEPAARSVFDGLSRLLPARGEAAEALDGALAKLAGLPVSAAFEVVSTATSEAAGMPAGAEPPRPPVETRQTVTRRVSNLVVRPGKAADASLFALPEDVHHRALDRIVPAEGP